ncbi:hypothetical protein Taro_019154 [Colocasia esculenta]|uniref:Transcriptional coactivator Hfi1/Transcriptional adapter 1 n=1 Tax=Colocasia esculenta TaxID=4460 RepID=A0A843UVL9_COLES|nr:hypothetical protein [Colocasia esculenta]
MPPPPPQHPRIDLAELRSQISRKLGPERSQFYFNCLNRLLSQKLSKSQFDKLCFAALGRENIPLHNQFIRSILRNASQAKVPPPAAHHRDALKLSKDVGKNASSTGSGLHPTAAVIPIWSNGKIRSTSCRVRDQPSPLGPNGKSNNAIAHQLLVPSDVAAIRENGDSFPCDLKRHLQHQQGRPAGVPSKKQRAERSLPLEQVTVHGKDPLDLVLEDGKFDQADGAQSIGGPLQAPLGIPYFSASIGGARRAAPLPTCSSSDGFPSNYFSGELCHTEDLRKRMQEIAEVQGLGSVTMECANLLNNGLDAYLKRLIRSCVELGGAMSRNEPISYSVFKEQPHGKIMNGIRPGNHMHIHSSAGYLDGTPEQKNCGPVSMLDFRVAMELNPQQLGEDWPLLLEKVRLHSCEE